MTPHEHNKKAGNSSLGVNEMPTKITVEIPHQIKVHKESSTEENQQYAEEKESRCKQLQAARRLNNISILGIIVAIASLIAVYINIVQSKETFQTGERAWVLIETASLAQDLNPHTPSTFVFSVQNAGHSPALHFWSETHFYLTGERCQPVQVIRSPYISDSIVAPGPNGPYPNLRVGPLPQQCLDALYLGKAQLRFSGTLHYEDIFRKKHKTEICVQYEGQSSHQMTNCPDGNNAD